LVGGKGGVHPRPGGVAVTAVIYRKREVIKTVLVENGSLGHYQKRAGRGQGEKLPASF